MDQNDTGKQPDQREQAARSTSESALAAEAAAAVMKSLSPESRGYFQGFLMGLKAAEEKMAG